MQEQTLSPAVDEKLQDAGARGQVEIESAVHKLELSGPSIKKPLHGGQKRVGVKGPHGCVERREAELAGERATSGGLDVDDSVFEVLIRVELVRRGKLGEGWEFGWDDVRQTLSSAL